MFGKNKNNTINEDITKIREDYDRKIKNLAEDYNREIEQIKKDYDSGKKILLSEIDTKIGNAVKDRETENNTLKQENAVLKKEVSILEKAFENLGFDVKDMKGILDKLVEGIISKNEINIIK